jgi:hypothetical protein
VSRQSPATLAFVSSPLPPAISGVIYPSNLEPSIHRFFHRFHPVRYVCILHSIIACPLQVLKGGKAFLIHRLRSKVPPQNLSIESPSCPSHHLSIQPSVNPRRYHSLTSPQKGDSLPDPCFILGPTASSSSSLHQVFSSHFSNYPIG